ncbi:MAG: hypothetical protein COU29_01370 [Candidatus Magasanikbacteria bacterium CG10_big_fil_rev_8_21_14_0_10_36_32]|uniref:Dipeptidylpeptidase IV N-terminal domain-containing protein n=1 Tax=Candidatus Magasanikbacteria bacterium CG10_big_fil_rev_8_21_14_0_10_36_32 TaxID=1974646 RepID=A0A2M6W6M2_9BACT|nr:MAG: hypothetical protein COU29_01370 [Candidatus Magasanikbacteria bacterium CG10_big_fil_rev_8_21_14_0_10_36_32]
MSKLKKILLITGLLAGTAILAFLLFYIFKKTSPLQQLPPTVPTEEQPDGGQFIPAGQRTATTTGVGGEQIGTLPTAGIIPGSQPSYYQPELSKKIISDSTNFVSLNKTGGVRYYNPNDGKFYTTLADGSTKILSNQTFYNVQKTTWANKQNKAILEFPDSSKILYDFDAQKQVTLPKHWEEFSFAADGEKVAAKSLGLSPENRWLVTINDDGTGTQLIEAMGENANKVIIDWSPSQQAIGFTMTGEELGMYRKEILLVGLNGENFKSFVAEGLGFQPQWSPTGKKLLYSVYSNTSDFKPEIWVVNSYGQEIGSGRNNLQINTWADKCTFANDDTLYCAVPKSMPTGAGINPAVAAGSTDTLYKIDLKSGLKTTVNTGGDFDMNNLSFDQTNNRLIFSDSGQTGVFEIKL